MSNKRVKQKIIRLPSKDLTSLWIAMAEDAERDIAEARSRIKQLSEAARIFRLNAESERIVEANGY